MAGCSVGPPYNPPSLKIPSKWKNDKDQPCDKCQVDTALGYYDFWWEVFEDDKLTELEGFALEKNRDLYVAYERIKESRALMGIAASEFYPQLYLNPQYTDIGELIQNYTNPSNTALNALIPKNTPFRAHELFYFLPLDMSYEVDLWGKIRDQYYSAKYNWLAQRKDYEVIMLTLTSNLAIAYYQLRALDAQIDQLLAVLKTRQKAYEINKARYEEEITFYADVTLAAQEIDTALLQYNEALRQRDVLEDQIAVLIGVPASEFKLDHMPLTGLPPCIPSGIPSEILLRRPDIAEAEDVVKADHSLVKYAYSLFYPSLTLTSTVGYESPILKNFLKWISRYWMLGAQASQLIFDGFKTTYYLGEQIARFKEASGEYQQQVLIAFQEIEDALANLESYAKQFDLAVARAQSAQTTHQLYSDRYQLGVIYYIDVSNTERDQLNYQIDVSSLRGYLYVSTIQFIKALGGGWD